MKATVGIRVEPEVETAGLDVSEHGMWGYPEFYIPVPGGYGTETPRPNGPAGPAPAAPPPGAGGAPPRARTGARRARGPPAGGAARLRRRRPRTERCA